MSNPSIKRFPRGIEVLIRKAAVDPEFKPLLLERRAAAAEEIGLELTAAEVAMLAAMPVALLEATIDQTEVHPSDRRIFLGKAAAAMFAALGLGGTGCSWHSHGHRAVQRNDLPIQEQEFQRPQIQGIEPDIPEPSGVKDIYFNYNSSRIRPDQTAQLEKNLAYFKEHPEIKIMIEGHCDERGSIEYNVLLGIRRAEAVRDYLMRNGISEDRLACISKGKEQPADPGHNEEAWARNRRVHFLRMY